MDFEKQLEQLEKITSRLEDKALSLEDGIKLYEDGLALTKECLKSLSESKGKIALIRKEMDKLTEEPFGNH